MRIMLRNTAGEIFSMDVDSDDTFQILKNKLQVESGINLDLEQLNFKARRVPENCSFKCLGEVPEQNLPDHSPSQDEVGDILVAQTSQFLHCLVPECGLSQREHPSKNFFVLPSDKERLHHWLLVCRRSDLIENLKTIVHEHYGICEDHFIGDNFVDSTKRTLKSEAIPTIFTLSHSEDKRDDDDDDDDDDDEDDDDDDDDEEDDEVIKEECEVIIKEELSDASESALLNENEDDHLADNISQLCRLCACSISDVVYIFNDIGQEQQIAKKINSCLPVTVKRTDPLPKQLCMSCLAKLNLCHEFAEACIQAEDKLLRLNRNNYFKSCAVNTKNSEYYCSRESLATLYAESSNLDGKIKYSENSHVDNDDTSKTNWSSVKNAHQESYGCPLCCKGNMTTKRDKSVFVNTVEFGSTDVRENLLYDSANFTDCCKFLNNDCSDNINIWETKTIETIGCDRSLADSEEIRDGDLMYSLQNDIVRKQQISEGKLSCRICGVLFESIELCISHAESHFEADFYPCNICDLCFTSLSSFKTHYEKHHNESVKSKVRVSKRLMCNLCGKRFNSERTLNSHTCGSSPRPYKCDECGKSFLTEVRLLFHQQMHQGGSAITCEHCGKIFSRENNLYDHVRLVHMGEKAHCCDQCGKTFQLKARLVAHQRVHTGERPFECDVCGGKFYDKATLKGHRLTHLDVKPFQCEKCGRCFARKTLFKQHTVAHLSEERKRPRTYSCRICGGSAFSSYAKLVEHRKEIHPDVDMNEVDDNAQVSKPFKCEDCGKSFAYRVTLVAHRRNHTGELPFQCEFCSKRFSQKRSLILHRRTHTGEKPFVCMECGKRFVQSAHLYSHTRLHTGEKPYACEVCGEAFRLKDVRDAHQRKHTGERPFKCNVCGKAFRTSHSYYQHMWIHQGKKPYPCSYCGKAFRRSNGLKIHIRIHTGEKPHSCDVCGRSFAQKQDMKKHRNLHGVGKV